MDAQNKFIKNKYASLSALVKHTRKAREDNGLAVSQFLHDGGVRTVLMHTSGEWIASWYSIPPTDSKGLSKAQEHGVVITYMRRYAYAAALGLITDEDTDANAPKSSSVSDSSANVEQLINEAPDVAALQAIWDKLSTNDKRQYSPIAKARKAELNG